MNNPIENRRYWDTPAKAILSTFFLSLTLLTAVSIIPLTLKQVRTHQETRIKADSIYTSPLITPISSNQVVVSFSTKIPATSKINLISTPERQTLVISPEPQTSHTITLKGLEKQTGYTFNITLAPTDRNPVTTNKYHFTTP